MSTHSSPEERFWSKVNKTETCWLWIGGKNSKGYGYTLWEGKSRPVHRIAHELLVGPIPYGLCIDHLCKVHNCVNPVHMEVVTNGENVMRGDSFAPVNKAKTHCPKGHAYDAANTHIRKNGRRACKRCQYLHGIRPEKKKYNKPWKAKQRALKKAAMA